MSIRSCCRSLATCSGLALLLPSLLSAQARIPVQRNPIVTEAKHSTTTLAFRDMVDVGWHNVSKVMPEHDRAPKRHISNQLDPVAQTEVLQPVSTTGILSFDGITDAQGG